MEINTEAYLRSKISLSLETANICGLSEQRIEQCLPLMQLFEQSDFLKANENKHQMKLTTLLKTLLYRVLPVFCLLVYLYFRVVAVYMADPCLLSQGTLAEFAMPLMDCELCRNISNNIEIADVTVSKFMEDYAFSIQPLLVKGAASHWPAVYTYSYEYFKDLYLQKPEAIEMDTNDGQFFAYSSNIHSINDFLNISQDVDAKKWYIGWSTSDAFIGEELRKHIREPYFLPPGSCETYLAWIFMGAPGPGASLHIDWVGRPSWQAQLSGTKTWTLVPPPECEYCCQRFHVTVHTGDIIVLDTNFWFHATNIHPGNISITFGTEYE